MTDENEIGMGAAAGADNGSQNVQSRSVTENIRDLTESTKELFVAGQKLTDNLNELEQRVERATDWHYQLSKNLWVIAGVAVAGGIVLLRFFGHRAD